MLLDAAPDAPEHLDVGWTPEIVASPRLKLGTAFWIAAGLGLLVVTWVVLATISFVLGVFVQSFVLGVVGTVAIAAAVAMLLYAGLLEASAYRSLETVERLRAVLAASDTTLATARAAALQWVGQVKEGIDDVPAVRRLIQDAATLGELRAVLRSRVADPLRERSTNLGRRAAVEGATLVALCPHPALDGLIAGLRGLLVIRRVAALYGLRPGIVVTVALLRRVAWTAAGTAGLSLVSQSLADHALAGLPVVKHIAGAIPGTGVVAVRLYRLAGVTAEACCPMAR